MMVYRASKMSDNPRCPRMWRRCREVVRRTVSTLGESSGEIKGIYRVARLSYKPTTAPTNSCAVFYLCRPRSARPLVSTLVGAGPSSAEWSGQQRSTRDLRTSEPIQKFAAQSIRRRHHAQSYLEAASSLTVDTRYQIHGRSHHHIGHRARLLPQPVEGKFPPPLQPICLSSTSHMSARTCRTPPKLALD